MVNGKNRDSMYGVSLGAHEDLLGVAALVTGKAKVYTPNGQSDSWVDSEVSRVVAHIRDGGFDDLPGDASATVHYSTCGSHRLIRIEPGDGRYRIEIPIPPSKNR